MKRNQKLILAGTVLVLFFAIFFAKTKTEINSPSETSTPIPKVNAKIGGTEILVEVADTPEKRTLGLSYRESLPENEGMLFDFGPEKIPVRFWMKGMNFPLDLIYIADSKVIQIHENALNEPGVADQNLKSYIPNDPVNYVLEVNAGFAEKNNVSVGARVILP